MNTIHKFIFGCGSTLGKAKGAFMAGWNSGVSTGEPASRQKAYRIMRERSTDTPLLCIKALRNAMPGLPLVDAKAIHDRLVAGGHFDLPAGADIRELLQYFEVVDESGERVWCGVSHDGQ